MTMETKFAGFEILQAREKDVPVILTFIRELAEFEKLSHKVTIDENKLRKSLFGANRVAEIIIAEFKNEPVAFALFFYTFSSFQARYGLYLEDLYVKPEMRGRGFGRAMMSYLSNIAIEQDCDSLEWKVLKWNDAAHKFYLNLNAEPDNQLTTYQMTGTALIELAQSVVYAPSKAEGRNAEELP
jgi:GNAT superfamily N-acetyltransferase